MKCHLRECKKDGTDDKYGIMHAMNVQAIIFKGKEGKKAITHDDVSWQPGGSEWPGLKCIGAIQTHFENKNGTSEEWHFYISSRKLTVERTSSSCKKRMVFRKNALAA